MSVARAEAICKVVTDKNLHQNCVFDVATTGDETFAKGYVLAQELKLFGTSVRVGCHETSNMNRFEATAGDAARPRQDHLLVVTARVLPLAAGRPIPAGSVTFFIDGVSMNRPVQLDGQGWASAPVGPLKPGEHSIRASYSGGGKFDHQSSSSAHQIFTIGPAGDLRPYSADQRVPTG